MTLDQQKAVAMASARMRMSQASGGNASDGSDSALSQIGRSAGLTARNLVEGVGALPAMALNVPAGLYNAAADAIQGTGPGGISDLIAGQKKGFRFRDQRENLSMMLDQAGLPRPQSPGERVGSDIAQGIAGAGEGVGIGNMMAKSTKPILSSLGHVLSDSPGLQAFLASAASGASGVAREAGQSPVVQMMSGVALPLLMLAGKGGAASAGRMLPTTANTAARAGQRIASAATDLNSLPANLRAEDQVIVPGSMPTTAQLTGDQGLTVLEQRVRAQNPAPFAQRASQQNAARLDQLDAVQPSGDPGDFTGYLQGKMRAIDQQTEAAHASAVQQAQQAAQGIGGTGTPEGYGSGIRDVLQQANNSARANERSLWKAVDPDGNLTVNGSPVRQAAAEIQKSFTPSAQPPSPQETAILKAASGYGQTVPFQDVGDLRSNISAAMRQELRTAGQTPSYARLAKLRGAVEDAISGAAHAGAQSQGAALPDVMASIEQRLAQDRQQWTTSRNGVAGLSANASGGTGRVSSIPGTASQVGGGFGNAAGDQSLPRQPFDQAAAERLSAATEATKQRAQTFGQPAIAPIIRKAGTQGQYRMPDAAVPASIFQAGPKGIDSVTAYRQAVGDEQALPILQDYAASALRKAAMNADGTLDANKVASFVSRYSDSLRGMPGLADKFNSVASASRAIEEAAATRRQVLDQYQTGALGKITGLGSADNVSRVVGGMLGSPAGASQMQQLATAAAGDPLAMEGLRKAVAEYVRQRFVTGSGADSTMRAKAFQSFMAQNQKSLGTVFSSEQIGSMNAIAEDLARTNRSPMLVSRSIPEQPSVLATIGKLTAEAAGAVAGSAVSHTPVLGPAVGWLGVKVVNAMRDAGVTRVDDLVREAMLHPEIAKALLAKVPANPPPSFGNQLATAMARATVFGNSPPLSTSYQRQRDNGRPPLLLTPPTRPMAGDGQQQIGR